MICIDIETGGLEPGSPVIQFAAVAVDGFSFAVRDQIEIKIQFDPARCDPEALKLNGYTAEAWESAIYPGAARLSIAAFFARNSDITMTSKKGRPYETAMLVGHNIAAFDVPRLREFMGSTYWAACWWYPLDTYLGAIWWAERLGKRLPNYQLATVAEAMGITPKPTHDALDDCFVCVEVAKVLMGRSVPFVKA